MKVQFKDSFIKDLDKIRDKQLLIQVRGVIEAVEQASNLQEVAGVKKLRGGESAFRIRVGDYRLGVSIEGDTAFFARFLHRKDIYRYFP